MSGKTIHQRNKSSPALSMTAGGGIAKIGAKRTAFGDVSNIAALPRPSKDDSNLPTKPGVQVSIKPIQPVPEKKTAAFTRPAQRPLSVSSLRNLLTGGNSSNVQDQNQKLQSIDAITQPLPSNARKVLTKRNTIFKDAVLDTVQEIDAPAQPASQTGESFSTGSETLVEPLPESSLHLPPPPPPPSHHVVEPVKEPIREINTTFSDASLPGIEAVSLEPNTQHSQPIYIEDQVVPDPVKKQEPVATTVISKPIHHTLPQPPMNYLRQPEAIIENFPRIPTLPPMLPPLEPQHVYHPALPEPEEYWEEDEEEPIEEEGYVTARSYRSKGENTTVGATTILFPKVSQRAKKELSAAKHLVEATRTAEEIEDESYDTSMVAEYGDEIFTYMKELEIKMLPNAHYMDNQHEIQWSMRSVLMDWLVQVHHRFNLLPETLFLCVNYIDRFLSCKVVSLGKLQLVGATAIFIAAKYEEINCPSVQEIVYMVDNGYSVDEILKAERFMLTMLQFELGFPGPMSFLRRISKADDYDLETRTLAKYFLEVTIMDERFIGSPPSFASAASHCLARLMLRKGNWVSAPSSRVNALHANKA